MGGSNLWHGMAIVTPIFFLMKDVCKDEMLEKMSVYFIPINNC